MNSEQPAYFQPLTLEKLNQAVAELARYQTIQDRNFEAWYQKACQMNPDLRKQVEAEIRREVSKWRNDNYDFEITENQIRSYLKTKL